jgi:hypothetical protein
LIAPGIRINSWEILSVDPSGRRACCECCCGAVRIIAVDALASGLAAASCGCQPIAPAQSAALRQEAEQQRRWHDLRWRCR